MDLKVMPTSFRGYNYLLVMRCNHSCFIITDMLRLTDTLRLTGNICVALYWNILFFVFSQAFGKLKSSLRLAVVVIADYFTNITLIVTLSCIVVLDKFYFIYNDCCM